MQTYMQVTLNLPEDVYRRAEHWAKCSDKPVADALAEMIDLSLAPLVDVPAANAVMEEWSDDEVMSATATEMPPEKDQRLSSLLAAQQAGELRTHEADELFHLMQVYQAGLLRKAVALREVVRRGLKPPIES